MDQTRNTKEAIHRVESLSFSALMEFELGSKQDLVYCISVIAYLLSNLKWRTLVTVMLATSHCHACKLVTVMLATVN